MNKTIRIHKHNWPHSNVLIYTQRIIMFNSYLFLQKLVTIEFKYQFDSNVCKFKTYLQTLSLKLKLTVLEYNIEYLQKLCGVVEL